MGTSKTSDVNLIIRARTEGEKAVEALAALVANLGQESTGAGAGVAELGRGVAALDKLLGTISTKADQAGSAFDRQTAALDKSRESLRGVAQEAADLQRNVDTVRRAIVDGALQGQNVDALRGLLRTLDGDMGKLDGRAAQLRRTIDNLEVGIAGSRSSLQQLGSTVIAVEEAQEGFRARIDESNAALQRQGASTAGIEAVRLALIAQSDAAQEAARNASAAQSFYNTKFSPSLLSGPATSNGASYALLIEQFQRLDAEAQRVHDSLDPLAAAVRRYEEEVASAQRLVANGHLGADELAAHERELTAALKDTLQQIGFVTAGEQDRVRKGLGAIEALTRAERAYANVLAERANISAALERSTGDGRLSATDLGASYRALEERERALAQRRALLEQGEAAVTRDAIARNTGDGRTPATSQGATFSALNARAAEEEAQAVREAELAYQMFEKAARDGATAMRAAESAAEADAADVQRLRDKLDPLAAKQRELNLELLRYRDLARRGKIGTDELAAAEIRLREEAEQARLAFERAGEAAGGNGRGQKGRIGLFGLKPYELTNLSYQANDVVTQLASGTSLAQTLAQQGGQILQLFPAIGGNLIGALRNPAVLAFVATVGVIAAGMKRAANDAERLRDVSGTLTLRADGGSYSAQGAADAAKDLDELGASAEDAQAAIKELLNDGVNPALLDQFAQAAYDTSKVLGIDLKQAASDIADAFTGGFEAVAKLDDKLNFLTATEREHIRELFNEGNAQAARTEALNAYTRQMEAAAAKQRGPWGEAAKSLTRAWSALIDWIANSAPIKITIGVLNELADVVRDIADAVADAVGEGDAAVGTAESRQTGQLQARIKQLQSEIDDYQAALDRGIADPRNANAARRVLEQSQRQLADAQRQLADAERKSGDTINGDPNGAAAKQRAERLEEIDLEQQLQDLRRRGSEGLTRADSARRASLAGEAAFRAEMKSTGDTIIAQRERERVVADETRQIDQQNDAARKKALQERETAIKNFEKRVVGAEGGTAQNPFSTAVGFGQFTEGTWLDQFRKVFPAMAADLSRQQILALREREKVARAIIDNYARENAKFLESFGAKVTEGNLYLAHFLGGAGAKAVLTAPGDTPVDTILRRFPNSDKVLSGNKGYLRTEGGKGRYRTADELEKFIANRVGDTGAPQSEGAFEIAAIIEDSRRQQDEFNAAVQRGNDERNRTTDNLRAQVGLSDDALLDEQRRQAVAQATLDLQQRIADLNRDLKPGAALVVVSPEQIAETERLAGALFDAQHAQERLNNAVRSRERPLDEYREQAQLLADQADYLRSIGENKAADALDQQFDAVNAKIREATERLVEFYQSLTPEQLETIGIRSEQQLDNLIGKLRQGAQQTQQWGKVAGISSRDIAQAFAGNLANSITSFFQRVGQGENVFKALGASVREFAANFISAIAQMLIQLLAFAAAVMILRALGVPIPSGGFGFGGGVPVPTKHSGGIAGVADGNASRRVNPAAFMNALRYHNGGIVGLKPNEVAAVLEKGEEVVTADDPRHINNFRGGATPGPAREPRLDVKIVNSIDPVEMLSAALASRGGQRVLVNAIRANKSGVKEVIG